MLRRALSSHVPLLCPLILVQVPVSVIITRLSHIRTSAATRGTKPHDDYVADVVRAVPAVRAGVRAVAGQQRHAAVAVGQSAGKIEFDGIPVEGLPVAGAAQQQPVAVHVAPPYHAW